jgi:SPP1 gp7 family putative phage head morphogenesis protein
MAKKQPGNSKSKSLTLPPGKLTTMAEGAKVSVTQDAIKAAMAPTSTGASINAPGASWFGPLSPTVPVVPANLQESVRGRQFDFASGYNLRQRPRADEAVSFHMMRNLADSCDVLRLVIETRKDQMAAQTFSVVPVDEKAPPDARCAEVEAFFKLPDGENDYHQWQRMVLEDMFVLDAVVVYPWLNNDDSVYHLDLIDPSTIKRVINDAGRTPQPPDPAYQQVLKGVPVDNYTADELVYAIRNKRTHKLYGYSPVEQIIITVNTAIRRTMHQLQFYTEGSTPDLLMSCPPDWNMDQVKDFNEWWVSMLSGNTAQRRQGVFIPHGVAPINTKDGALADKYDEWLARIVCYCFSVSCAPFVAQMNRATAESAADAALLEGLHPIMLWQASFLNYIIWKYWGYTDLHVKWDETKSVDPQVQASIDDMDLKNGSKTINEVRAARGDDTVDGGDKPLIYLVTGPVELSAIVAANTQAAINPPPPPPVMVHPGAAGAVPGAPGEKPPVGSPAPAAPAAAPAAKPAVAKLAKGAAAKKATPAVSRIDRDRPAVVALQRVLKKKVKAHLARVAAAAVATAVTRYAHTPKRVPNAGVVAEKSEASHPADCKCSGFHLAKAANTSDVDEATVQAILDALDLGSFQDMTPDIAAVIEQVMKDSGSEALKQLGVIIDDDSLALVNENAVAYAQERAGELVSQLSDSTREMLRSDVEDALTEGWSNDELADTLSENYGFSDSRADTIARTETAFADVQGNLKTYTDSGLVGGKTWITGDGCCDLCGDMDGVTVDLDDTFDFDGEAIDGPPGHPNCRCDFIPVVKDETDEEAADRMTGGDDTPTDDDDGGETVEQSQRAEAILTPA